MKFREWLLEQRGRDDYVGDFASDWCEPDKAGWLLACTSGTYDGLLYWLHKAGASRVDDRAFEQAWAEWWRLMRDQRNRERRPWAPIREYVEYVEEWWPGVATFREAAAALRARHGDSWSLHAVEWEPQDRPGYVYFMRADNGVFKIGRSVDPEARLKQVGLVVPYELTLYRRYRTDDCWELERSMHCRYAHRHLKGEWFRLSETEAEQLVPGYCPCILYQPGLEEELRVA